MNLLRSIGVFLILLVLCVLAYWDIATFQDTLKWDMLDCYYPWKYFVAECVKYQVFPLWNPYQHLGYPIYADMRSVFYPESFIVGLLGGYNLRVLHFLFIFNITVAGMGIYRLVGLYTSNTYAKLAAAFSYVLCGYFVGHGQEMFGIISGTWIPWVLHYFIRFQRSLSWSDLWKLALVLFLQLTGGYQALSLMLFYLLLFLVLANAFTRYKNDGLPGLTKMTAMYAALGMVVLASLTVLLVTYVQVAPHAARLTGLTLEDANLNSLTWRAVASLVTPFAVTTNTPPLGVDITMANIYVGLLMLALYALSFFRKRSTTLLILQLFGLVTFLASLGPLTPVREFLFYHVPLMNLFRMSSFFSYFTQLSIILLGAIELGRILDDPEANRKRLSIMLGALALVITGVGFYHYTVFPTAGLEALLSIPDLLPVDQAFDFSQRAVFHAAIQLLLLFALLLGIWRSARKPQWSAPLLLAFIVLEMGVAVNLNFPSTVGGGFDPSHMQEQLASQPRAFPLPDLNRPLRYNLESKGDLSPLFHNTNIFSKTVSWDGFNSFRLDLFEAYRLENTAAFDAGLKLPLLFLHPELTAKGITITDFAPNKMVCSTSSEAPTTLVYQQTGYQGWKASIDGVPAPITLHDSIFPSVSIPSGDHTIEFVYENTPVLIGFGISYLVLLFILLCIAYHYVIHRSENKRNARLIAAAFGLVVVGSIGMAYSFTDSVSETRNKDYEAIIAVLNEKVQKQKNTLFLLQVDDPKQMQGLLAERGWSDRSLAAANLWGPSYVPVRNGISSDSIQRVVIIRCNQAEDLLLNEIVHEQFPTRNVFGDGQDKVYEFERTGERERLFFAENDFEDSDPVWGFDFARIDSTSEAYSGNFGWTVGVKENGSPGFSTEIGKITDKKRIRIVYSMKCLVPTGNERDANLFVQILRDEKEFWLAAVPIATNAPNGTDWFDVTLLAIPQVDLQKDDVLRVFVWANASDPIHIDDNRISIYAEDQ